jgi:hypothetical protein
VRVIRAGAPFRVTRGCAVAAVGLVLAWTAHVTAGGSASPGPALVVVAVLTVAFSVLASDRAWTRGRLVVVLTLTQLALHGASWLAGASSATNPRLQGLSPSAHVHDHVVAQSPVMLVAHVAAVAFSAVVLAGVDRSVAALWAVAHTLLGLVRPRTVPTRLRTVPVSGDVRGRVRSHDVATSRSRRGPPAVPAPC